MLEKLHKIVFLLIIFFLSSQVGSHFWPEFSKISGIRIDYLSPTFFLLDILIVFLFLLSLPKLSQLLNFILEAKFPKLLFVLFILSLTLNLFYSRSPAAHLFGIVKLLEFLFLGVYVAYEFQKRDIRSFVYVLSASAVVSSFLAIWQFVQQSSVGGLWYFFGERTFNTSTIGISTVNLHQLILRPYAAFPHPNVLAFFLLMSIVFAFMKIPYEKKVGKVFLILSILASSSALLLTFSRIIILLAILGFLYAFYTNGKRNAFYFVPILIIMFVSLGYFVSQVLSPQSLFRGIDFRQELLTQSFQIFLNNPYFGIGLNNFFVHQTALVKNISPILFQPPHNIFVLALLHLGVFSFWIFPAMFWFAIRSVIKKQRMENNELRTFYKSILIILIAIIIVGIFDHFFLTLEQGQIVLALIFGLSFAKLLPESFKKREG